MESELVKNKTKRRPARVFGFTVQVRSLYAATLAVMLLCGPALTPLNAYSLYLKGSVLFEGELRLGQIARISKAVDTQSLAGKLVVRELQAPLYLTAEKLQTVLQNTTPEKLEQIYGQGVWLIPLNQSLSKADLEKLLLGQIHELPDADQFFQQMQLTVPETIQARLPARGIQSRFRLPASARSLTAGQRMIALDVYAAKAGAESHKPELLLRLPVKVEIRQWVSLAVADRDMPAGTALQTGAFHYEKRALFSDTKDYDLKIKAQSGALRTVRPIKAGEVLTIRNVHYLPTVRRGQKVNLVYQSPGLVLKMPSIAQTAGEAGDQIQVRVVLPGGRSGRSLAVRIADQNQVVYEGP
ncbi:MAG: flagellar basal body P-ring formation protein FlgA [Leptospiraceae bacterium]|nr:flagellar basal body P-ring formation protein FlgA [Leptospiraceae bacterium]